MPKLELCKSAGKAIEQHEGSVSVEDSEPPTQDHMPSVEPFLAAIHLDEC
jgi:hypothetical protein